MGTFQQYIFLAYLATWAMWGIVITLHPSSSVSFAIHEAFLHFHLLF
jgi:hypothetical protein